jgi:hypothetical protein
MPGDRLKLASIEAIASVLHDAKARYLVAGGLAVAAHGFGRVTFDVDLVVQLQPDNLQRALRALESLGYHPAAPVTSAQFADVTMREAWVREKSLVVLQLISEQHRDTPIDLFAAEPFDFDQEYRQALLGEVFPGVQMRFVSLDTLIRMKEVAGREKDREDIRQLKLIKEDPGAI